MAAMTREPGFSLGSVRGIRLRADPSLLGIAGLLLFVLASEFESVLAAAVATVLFLASILAHELAHSLVARSRNVRVDRVTLFLFGGVSEMRDEPRRAIDEFLIAGVGPLSSAVLGGAFLALGSTLPGVAGDVASWLGRVNLAVAVFNLLPGFPLDGGRILRAFLWGGSRDFTRSTRVASGAGAGVAGVLMAAGVALIAWGAVLDGLWLAALGWFLYAWHSPCGGVPR